jgi:O-antigen ligase
VARRWGPWKLQALAAPLALAAIAAVAVVRGDDFRQSRLHGLYEHVASMADFSGTGRYTTDERRYVGDNNRFRLAWWRSVAEETRDGGPVFGLGFGYDLADRFVKTYELDLGEDFSARSPHSVVFTVLGRMGLVGLLILVGIVGAMAAATWRLARRVRTDDAALPALGWWSVAWVLLVSGCFGVVLEGPMGAVIFWTALGMAHATSTESPADELERAREPAAALPSAAGSA